MYFRKSNIGPIFFWILKNLEPISWINKLFKFNILEPTWDAKILSRIIAAALNLGDKHLKIMGLWTPKMYGKMYQIVW